MPAALSPASSPKIRAGIGPGAPHTQGGLLPSVGGRRGPIWDLGAHVSAKGPDSASTPSENLY